MRNELQHSKGGTSVNDVHARNGRDSQILDSGDGVLPVATEIVATEIVASEIVATVIRVHNGPISGIVASPDGGRLLVTNYGSDTVSVIDTDTCRVVETVDGVNEPYAIAMGGSDPDRAYVTTVSPAYDSIAVIDVPTNAVTATHPLALSVSDLAVSADGRYVYASRNGVRGADVVVLDTTTGGVEVIDLPEAAEGSEASAITTECVRVSPDGARLYVGTNGPAGGRLVVFGAKSDDATTGRTRWRKKGSKKSTRPGAVAQTGWSVLATIAIGLPIRDVALSPNGATAYVASCGVDCDAVVDVVDTRKNKITGTRKIAEIGGILTGMTLSGDGDRAYLVSDDRITVLCTLTHDVTGTLRVAQPSCVVESQDGKNLYIADYSGAVIVAPVASAVVAIGSDIDSEAAEWAVPELLAYEPALA
jgi:YVTN family beta-propeller protein